ncbi:MAG: TonB-dependent receptor [Porticoccaceae bacterium]
MSKFTFKKSCLPLAVATLLSAGAVQAQIDEIVVTANKREQTLQEVPISVSVTTGETIQRASIVDLIDLQTSVPSLRVNQLQSSAQTNFVIRGYGNGANNPGIEPAVSVYIDGVPRTRSSAMLADLPTVERIEVLSGPQSTLFGKNASAGVINVTTMLPEDELGGMLEATAANYDSRIIKGTLTGPITDNLSFRLSASDNSSDGYGTNITTGDSVNTRDRYAIRGQLLYTPADDLTIRLIADYNEIDEVCCAASALSYGDASRVAAMIAAQSGFDTTAINPWARELNMNYNPTNQLEGKGVSLQIDKDLGFATLTSITSTRDQSLRSNFDADFSAAEILGENRVDYDFETFTQELRLSSNGDGDLQWMVGLFHSDESVDSFRTVKYGDQVFPFADFLIGAALAPPGTPANLIPGGLEPVATILTLMGAASAQAEAGNLAAAQQIQALASLEDPAAVTAFLVANGLTEMPGQMVDTWFVPGTGNVAEDFDMEGVATSIFTQFDYNLSENMTVTLGLNYTEDKKTVISDVLVIDPFAELPLAGGPLDDLTGLQLFPPFTQYGGTADESGVFKSDDLTHTFRLAYDINDSTTVYASHSTGFKAASVNLSVDGRTPGNRTADPEEATNIEFGLKTTFDNGYLNIAYFDQTIEGFQSNIFSGTGFNLENAGKETHEGVELDGMLALSENVVLGFSAIYIDAIYDEFLNGTCDDTGLAEPEYSCPAGQSTIDLSGRSPAGVHELSYNVNATISFEVSGGIEGFLRLEYLYEDDVKVADLIPYSIANRGSDNINASLGFSSENGGWDAMLWGRNLTDHESLISAFVTPAQPGSWSGYPNAPRTYGFTLRKNF